MTVDYPTPPQICGLRALWKEAFGDTDAFLDSFFEVAFSSHRCRCVSKNGLVLAALYWFEVSCKDQRFAYLYAVATAKSHRGQGLFSALLADTTQILKEEGFDGILLVPESESLARMYEKFGFFSCTFIREFSAEAGNEPVILHEIGPGEFVRLRRQFLPIGAVLQEGADLNFLSTQCHFWAGENWLAAGLIYDGKLVCQEFLGDDRAIPGLLRALDVPCGSFRGPGKEKPFGYLLPLHKDCLRPGYFALALD